MKFSLIVEARGVFSGESIQQLLFFAENNDFRMKFSTVKKK
jgi:hypothetical protein